jgi:protein-L-isoaspartate(D-aspartate) O-methyltransferase
MAYGCSTIDQNLSSPIQIEIYIEKYTKHSDTVHWIIIKILVPARLSGVQIGSYNCTRGNLLPLRVQMVSYDDKNRYAIDRRTMIDIHLRGRDIRDQRVLNAMERLPRESFLGEKYASNAYDDNPLPIGMGQTISQPYIVALMTQCLDLSGNEEVLEIGTGSGYQTAVLSELAAKVYTIERFGELSEQAQASLAKLDCENIEFSVGDGSCGWPEDRLFDRIIITAAVPEVPEPLKDQLKEGGLLVAPVGGQYTQELIIAKKDKDYLSTETICGCRFVKLIGQYAYGE